MGEQDGARTELVNQKLELEIEKLQREKLDAEADWEQSRVYHFFESVDTPTVESCIDVTMEWSRKYPGAAMTIVFNSPGGDVLDGLALYDHLFWLRSQGHHITTIALGMAASMGGVLLQAGNERIISPNSWILIHEVSTGVRGKISEVEDDVKLTERLQKQILDILSSRAKFSRKQIQTRWKRRDWWLDAKEAIKYGFADRLLGEQEEKAA